MLRKTHIVLYATIRLNLWHQNQWAVRTSSQGHSEVRMHIKIERTTEVETMLNLSKVAGSETTNIDISKKKSRNIK